MHDIHLDFRSHPGHKPQCRVFKEMVPGTTLFSPNAEHILGALLIECLILTLNLSPFIDICARRIFAVESKEGRELTEMGRTLNHDQIVRAEHLHGAQRLRV